MQVMTLSLLDPISWLEVGFLLGGAKRSEEPEWQEKMRFFLPFAAISAKSAPGKQAPKSSAMALCFKDTLTDSAYNIRKHDI